MSLFGILGSVLGGALSAGGANKAAKAQERAAQAQIDLQREIYGDQTERFDPFLQGGTNAFGAYLYEMGLGPRPGTGPRGNIRSDPRPTPQWAPTQFGGQGAGTQPDPGQMMMEYNRYRAGRGGSGMDFSDWKRQTYPAGQTPQQPQAPQDRPRQAGTTVPYRGFTATPGYQFRLQQGNEGILSNAALRGTLNSGNTLKALTEYGQGVGAQEYGNYMNRLAGLADTGMSAAGMQANAGNAFASGASQAYGNMGNAQAAGAIGQANAWNDAIGNAFGVWQYMKPGSGGGGGPVWQTGWHGGGR